ncbi:MAG: hypothetical protein DLM59_08995 [Pseudonocardiales bacterium]|nr:MAG: hypothetical protein DLM59_08995 [Pseudonocardiales bacterium]
MFSAELSYVRLLVHVVRGRFEQSGDKDRGASAIEWAVITAIMIVVASTLAIVIRSAVQNHSKAIV